MAGLQVTGAQLNQRIGQISQDLRRNYEDAVQVNNYLLAHPVVNGTDPLEAALGIAAADLAVIRAAAADLAYAKAQSFDSSQNVKVLWGLGS